MSKRLLNRSLESDLETALDEEAMVQSLVTQSEDTKEGMLRLRRDAASRASPAADAIRRTVAARVTSGG